MLVSELIAALQKCCDEHGNVRVAVRAADGSQAWINGEVTDAWSEQYFFASPDWSVVILAGTAADTRTRSGGFGR